MKQMNLAAYARDEARLHGEAAADEKRRLQREWLASGGETTGPEWEAFRTFTLKLGQATSDERARAAGFDYAISEVEPPPYTNKTGINHAD